MLVLQTTDESASVDDDTRQRPLLVWPLTLCV